MTQELQKAAAANARARRQKVIDLKKLDYNDQVLYLNAKITGASNTISLVDSTTKKVNGITNFDGNVLGLGKSFPISAMRVLYSNAGANETVANWQDKTTLPAELQNSVLTITQNNNVLVSLPLTDLQNFANKEFRSLATVPVIVDRSPFTITIEMPKEARLDAPVGKQCFFRLELKGIEIKSV